MTTAGRRFTTGVSLLDRNLGGLLAGRSYLIFGPTGTGKTLLGLQFLIAGMECGEPGMLLTLERPQDVLVQGESLSLFLEAFQRERRFVLLEYQRDISAHILRYGLGQFVEKLRPLVLEHGIRRFVVDPLHPLLAGNSEEARLRDDLRQLADTLETWGVTTVLLNSVEATRSHPSFYPVFLENCSGVLELCDEIVSAESRYHLFVHKLRHWAGPRRRIPYELAAGVGVVPRQERKQTSARAREMEELLGRGEE